MRPEIVQDTEKVSSEGLQPAFSSPSISWATPESKGSKTRILLRRVFGSGSKIRRSSNAPPETVQRDWIGWGAAFALAALVAGLLEWILSLQPVPSGSDEGAWLTYSYPFVGLPYPSHAVPVGYPPLSFPVLGVLVRFTGGPLSGARGFVAVAVVALGLAMYYLGRACFASQILAIFFEGLVLLEPAFMRLVFFGSYPILFSFVFFGLALAFALQFLASRRVGYLLVFWTASAAVVLTHTLSALVLGVWISLFGVFLALSHRLPREVFTSRSGQIGLGIFGFSVGGYYLLSQLLGIGHPTYTQSAGTMTPDISRVVGPFQLPTIANLLHLGFSPTPAATFAILVGTDLLILVSIVLMSTFRPTGIRLPVVATAMWGIAPTMLAIGGYAFHVLTDYTRFAFLLYPPLILGGVLLVDFALHRLRRPSDENRGRPAYRGNGGPPPAAQSPRVGYPRPTNAAFSVVLSSVVVVELLLIGAFATFPIFLGYEAQYTATAHDRAFLDAVAALQSTGIPGGILTDSVQSSKWISALTARNTFLEFHLGEFETTAQLLLRQQLTYYALTTHYAVTNNLVIARLPGVTPPFFQGVPVYSVYQQGLPEDALSVGPGNLSVIWSGSAPPTPVYLPGTTNVSVLLPNSGIPSMSIVLRDPNLIVDVNITLPWGVPTAAFAIMAQATGPARLAGIDAALTPAAGARAIIAPNGTNRFSWVTFGTSGPFSSQGSVQPPSKLTISSATSHRTTSAVLSLRSPVPGGVGRLELNFSLSTPAAQNGISSLPPTITAPGLWAMWQVRFGFFAVGNFSTAETSFLVSEFGAFRSYSNAEYGLVLLPALPLSGA